MIKSFREEKLAIRRDTDAKRGTDQTGQDDESRRSCNSSRSLGLHGGICSAWGLTSILQCSLGTKVGSPGQAKDCPQRKEGSTPTSHPALYYYTSNSSTLHRPAVSSILLSRHSSNLHGPFHLVDSSLPTLNRDKQSKSSNHTSGPQHAFDSVNVSHTITSHVLWFPSASLTVQESMIDWIRLSSSRRP